MADGHILSILMCGDLVNHHFILYIPCIVLGVPGILPASNQSLDITATRLLPSKPGTPDITTTINYPVISVDPRRASGQPAMSADLEALVAPGLREDSSSAERVCESVPADVHEDVEGSNYLPQSINNRTPGSEDIERFTASQEATLSSTRTSLTSQAIATLYPTSDSLLDEQKAAVELRSLLPLLEERAGQRHALLAWDDTWTRVTEQVRVEETRMDNADQEAEVHTRRKRRGGKRNTLWKTKCRQDKDDYERHPEAGPSGLR
ncbi:hypothetical protein M407DRAFT_27853 [Tulasnella calospora MUT 4182]|uniref:Uncharacterized protein n=1 Tax=Tulasnella calospora MUT 4182 TaxID=1051891 RepID=A0A0C3QBS4_9AGAM|nr:hypothetical protein M407DRAFT_27853 [Tulasnella calospora MUT 4182]